MEKEMTQRAKVLKQCRNFFGLNQEQMAKKLHISHDAVSRRERGEAMVKDEELKVLRDLLKRGSL